MSYITDTSTPASKVIHLDSAHAHVRYLKDDEGNELTTNFLYHMALRTVLLCLAIVQPVCIKLITISRLSMIEVLLLMIKIWQ